MISARTRHLVGSAALVALAAGTTVVASASSLPTAVYQASISPTSATVGQPGGFTVTLTDCGVVANTTTCSNPTPLIAFDNMHAATIRFADAPGTVLAVSPSTWTATLSGSTVSLMANSTSNDLTFGQTVSVTVPVPSLPSQVGTDAVTTSATDASGFTFSRNGNDPALTVNAGSVAHVVYTQQPGNIVAGNAFTPTVAVEPTNQYGVAEANTAVTLALQNAAGAVLSGTVSRNTDASSGIATFPGVSVAKAGTGYTLLASAGGVSQASSPFSVTHGPLSNLTYTQQPSETQLGTAIVPAVKVAATDSFGNPIAGAPVTVSLHQNSAGGHLAGTLTQTTDATGTATFGNLSVDTAGFGYTLLATSGTVSRESSPFVISTTASTCTTYPCTQSATDAGGATTSTVTLTGLNQPSGLFLTMYNPSTYAPPTDACGASGFEGSGTRIDVAGGGGTPSKTITWRLDRSLVNLSPNNGAGQYSICMGAVNTSNPSQTWITKNGGLATLEADGKYWGLLPFCANVVTSQPCITSQSKNGQGDVVIAISVPAPWDEQFVGGLLHVA